MITHQDCIKLDFMTLPALEAEADQAALVDLSRATGLEQASVDIQCPEEMIRRMRGLEEELRLSGREVLALELANAICCSRWGERPQHMESFLVKPDFRLKAAVTRWGLEDHFSKSDLFDDPQIQWCHFLAPFAARFRNLSLPGQESHFFQRSLNLFKLEPGIRPERIERSLISDLVMPFWYSIGGDTVQDQIDHCRREDELRGDILGIEILGRRLHEVEKMSLSTLIAEGFNNRREVEGEGYKNSFYYKLAEAFIKPLIGHEIVGFLKCNLPTLYRYLKLGKCVKAPESNSNFPTFGTPEGLVLNFAG